MLKYNTPQELFTAICNKIRDKTNSNELINHQDIPDKIDKLTNNDIKLFIDSAIQGENTIHYSFNNTTITKINSRIFATTNLTNIDLPECTSIGEYAFSNCTSLTTVDLPECTSIDNYAFEECNSLTTVDLPECTSIGNYAFAGCSNLTTINLPECSSIGNNAFHGCNNLTTIDLPECTSIGNYAFHGCTSLTTVDLPECTSIGDYAFGYCTNLTTVIFGADQVAHIEYAFVNSSIANGTGYIYVPDNLVDSYKTATNWSTYANQFKPISELPSELKEEYGYE